MNLKYLFLLSCVVITLQSCDFLSTMNKKIVGNIYVINPQTQSDNGFSLIYMDGTGVNDNILNDYILSVNGNDSILLAHCLKDENEDVYYKINHNKGIKPINVTKIYKEQFDSLISITKMKYSFN